MSNKSLENFYNMSLSQASKQSNLSESDLLKSYINAHNSPSTSVSSHYQGMSKSYSTGFLSKIEQDILKSNLPIELEEEYSQDEVTVNGVKGILMNKQEIENWKGSVPLSEYKINEDSQPEVIHKRSDKQIFYNQNLAIRYLRPPTPPPPGDIYIHQENIQLPPAPPLIIRQQPPRPETPPPLVIREAPPTPPPNHARKIIYIQGKKIPPPPRKVIIERLPPLPSKPQSIIIERWLPYKPVKRRVIFQRANADDPVLVKTKNLVVQWEKPSVTVKKEFKDLGIVRTNPSEYSTRYGSSLKKSVELPGFVKDIRPPKGMVLAAQSNSSIPYELEGDLHALSLVDLESEGLNEYKSLLRELNLDSNKQFLSQNFKRSPLHSSTSLASPTRSEKNKNFIIDIFNLVDQNSTISLEEAESLLLGLYTRLGIKYGKTEANHFFRQIEFNENGTVDLDRFRSVLEKEFI